MQALRYWDYYNMTDTFTSLYDRASKKEVFSRLYEIATSRENILLAYRTMKSNKGSRTPGTDGKTIADIQKLSEDELVHEIQNKLNNYRPNKVRRKCIEKDNGKSRPLGIPCILDRIIQQCFKQVFEPIAEAHFYNHSYGFRPLRSTHHANQKGNKRVAHTSVKARNKRKIKEETKARIKKLRASPTAQNALLFNSFVLGIHNYFKWATHVNLEFSRLAYDLRAFMFNRLKQIGKYEHPENAPPTYKKFYSRGFRTFKLANVYLYPLADVKTRNTMSFSQQLTLYTAEGREQIHQKLRPDIQHEITLLMKSSIPNRSVEYLDNRISRCSMKMGKCEVTGTQLFAADVHCHHYIPIHLGGKEKVGR